MRIVGSQPIAGREADSFSSVLGVKKSHDMEIESTVIRVDVLRQWRTHERGVAERPSSDKLPDHGGFISSSAYG